MGFQLLATKLNIPAIRPNIVQRNRLLESFQDTLFGHSRLINITAPAGFGKTTLVGDWLKQKKQAVAWVSLDVHDNEPAKFWSYVFLAVQQVAGQSLDSYSQLIQSPNLSSRLPLITDFINFLTAVESFVLVLDDFHVITHAEIHSEMVYFVDNMPSNVTLVLTSRIDPPLPLARYRAKGMLTELRADDLRFTTEETQAFLQTVFGLHLKPEQIHTLDTKTEGWITGIQLAALSLKGRSDIEGFLSTFTGSHRFILSYLIDEVLTLLDDEVQDFLLQTAILKQLSADLCNAVTGRTDSRAMLERLYEENLFVVPLDDYGEWYRYHHLFAEVLEHHSQRHAQHHAQHHANPISPAQAHILHQRAAEWFLKANMITQAIEHFIKAEAYEDAALSIVQYHKKALSTGDIGLVRSWLEQIPEAYIEQIPALAIVGAWVAVFSSQVDQIEPYIKLAGRALASTPERSEDAALDAARLEREIRVLRVQVAVTKSRFSEAIDLGEAALENPDHHDELVNALLYHALALSHRVSGNLQQAILYFGKTRETATATGDIFLSVNALSNISGIYEVQGKLRGAWQMQQEVERMLTNLNLMKSPFASLVFCDRGKLLREWNRLPEAMDALNQAVALARKGDIQGIVVDSLITLALVYMGMGDLENAHRTLDEAEQIALGWGHPDTLIRLNAFRARFWIVRGELWRGTAWAGEVRPVIEANHTELYEIERTVLARIDILSGNAHRAITQVDAWMMQASNVGRNARVIELNILKAWGLSVLGRTQEAVDAMNLALSMAMPEGFVRIFLDEGEPVLRLLEICARTKTPKSEYAAHEYAAHLLGHHAPTANTVKADVNTDQGLIEPLSERELEVLALLAEGLTDQEIADRLFISRRTVKKHNENIYGKLSVSNRTQAVVRADELGLL